MDEKARIHASYIMFVLGSIIVALITIEWSSIPRLPELITFALTVSSLILALLAIVYAYVSNFSSQQTTGRLISATETIVKSAEDVRRATDILATQVSDIPSLVSSVGERVDQTHALIKDYATRQPAQPPQTTADVVPDDDFVTNFLQTASVSGLLALLALKYALEKKKVLDIPDF